MSDPGQKAPDTATPAPQVEPIDIVDTPAGAPGAVETGGSAGQPQGDGTPLIAGKYRTMEEAEAGIKAAERAMHEANERAAQIQREWQQQRQVAPPQPPEDFDAKFRERLADDPAGTMASYVNFLMQRQAQEQFARSQQMMQRFQSFAQNPEYADVVNEVAQTLPFANEPVDPVEASFLRASNAKLRQALAAKKVAAPPHVEGAGGASPSTGRMTLELESPDKVRARYNDQQLRELGRMVANHKNAGGDMRGMSIDDFERATRNA